MRIPGRTMTTGQENQLPSAVSIRTLADSAAGLREQTALAAGEACTPADSAVSMVASTVSVDSTEEDSMDGAKGTRNIAGLGGRRMWSLVRDRNFQIVSIGLVLTLLMLIIATATCPRGEVVAAAKETPRTFASPQDAGTALLQAAKSGDQAALLEIFGPDGKEILFSGDPAADQTALKDFAA